MNLDYPIDPQFVRFNKINLYKGKNRYYLIGHDDLTGQYSMLEIRIVKDKSDFKLKLNQILQEISLDSCKDYGQIQQFLQKKDPTVKTSKEGNYRGIIGFFKFLEGYYMLAVEQIESEANIGKHEIYTIKKTKLLKLFENSSSSNEKKYRKYIEQYFLEIGFYFSYTYDLTNSLAHNLSNNAYTYHNEKNFNDSQYNPSNYTAPQFTNQSQYSNQYSNQNQSCQSKEQFTNKQVYKSNIPERTFADSYEQQEYQYKNYNIPKHVFDKDIDILLSDKRGIMDQFCEIFYWNYNAQQELGTHIQNKKWLFPVIHGYLEQRVLQLPFLFISLTLISRRSRHYAGTRYNKRGIDQKGFVANFVETEQIVIDLKNPIIKRPTCSSFVQIRGSAPTFWNQKPNMLTPKPDINIIEDNQFLFTKKHISDIFALYGDQIFALNLVKSNEKQVREKQIADQYQIAMDKVNEDLPNKNKIKYYHFDMKLHLKRDKEEFLETVYSLGYYTLLKTGLFFLQNSTANKYSQITEFQNGVLRSNCIDCLDRTNTFQQLVGEIALGIQILKINKQQVAYKNIDLHPKIVENFREMYEQNGDLISLQYGSSIAHKQNIKEDQKKRFEFFTSIQRHFRNNFSDLHKQQQIDLFLGNFNPQENLKNKGPHLWDKEIPINQAEFVENPSYQIIKNDGQWFQESLKFYPYNKRIKFFSDQQSQQSIEVQNTFKNELQTMHKNQKINKLMPKQNKHFNYRFNIDIYKKLKSNNQYQDDEVENNNDNKQKQQGGGIILNLVDKYQGNKINLQQIYSSCDSHKIDFMKLYKNVIFVKDNDVFTPSQPKNKDKTNENKENDNIQENDQENEEEEEDEVDEEQQFDKQTLKLNKKLSFNSNKYTIDQQQSYQDQKSDFRETNNMATYDFQKLSFDQDQNDQVNQNYYDEFNQKIINYDNLFDDIQQDLLKTIQQCDYYNKIDSQNQNNHDQFLQLTNNNLIGEILQEITDNQTQLKQNIDKNQNLYNEISNLQYNDLFGPQSIQQISLYNNTTDIKKNKKQTQIQDNDDKNKQSYKNNKHKNLNNKKYQNSNQQQSSNNNQQHKCNKQQLEKRKMEILTLLMKRNFPSNTQTKISKI